MTIISAKKRIAIVGLAVAAALAFAPRAAATPAAPASSKATYYLSLGDSLAQGVQPIGGPWSPSAPRLQPGLRRSAVQADARPLSAAAGGQARLRRRDDDDLPLRRRLLPTRGSQLAEAAAFLEEHGEEVAFVTIDIGGNDLTLRRRRPRSRPTSR